MFEMKLNMIRVSLAWVSQFYLMSCVHVCWDFKYRSGLTACLRWGGAILVLPASICINAPFLNFNFL